MELDIEKFSPATAELNALVEKAKLITRESAPEDVHEMRMKLVKTRTSITKTGKSMREDALKFQKAVIAKENELVGIIAPEEERLGVIEDEIAIAKLREERLALLPARMARIEAIADSEPFPGDDVLLDMDGPQFEGYLNQRVAEKNRKDQLRIDEEKQKLADEQAKLDREKEIEEAKKRAAQDERDRIEREAKEKKEREAREKKETEEREEQERQRLERESHYQEFLAGHGYTADAKEQFHIERSGAEIKLYKLVGTFKTNQQ